MNDKCYGTLSKEVVAFSR